MKHVFVSGASSGIGLGLAQEWLKQGAAVYGVGRRSLDTISIDSEAFSYRVCDVSNEREVADAVGKLLAGVSNLDVVVLNAGILGRIADLKDVSVEEMQQTMNVNLWSNKYLVDRLMSEASEVKQVVAMSSGASVNGSRGWNGYSLSKAALNMLMKLYAAEYPNTHFSALAPGLVDTAMQSYLCEKVDARKFSAIGRIKAARHTPTMPSPEELSPVLINAIRALKQYPSGTYQDIRTMSLDG